MSDDPKISPAMASIFPDLPVETASGLAFEFEGLAKTLEELARNPDNQTPFTVVVKGGWGPDGVRDLAGNVWEWCQDRYGRYDAKVQSDPTGPERGDWRALRGGAFTCGPYLLRCAFRERSHPNLCNLNLGFRVVVSPWFSGR